MTRGLRLLLLSFRKKDLREEVRVEALEELFLEAEEVLLHVVSTGRTRSSG